MKNALLATLALAAVLSGPSVVRGQHGGHGSSMPTPSVPDVRTGKTTGKVVELSESSITVETSKKGQTLKATYVIDRGTKTKGSPAVGEEVVVKYREERGAPVATNIEVKKTKRSGA